MSHKLLHLHEEIEELVEAHTVDCSTLGNNLNFLRRNLQNTEELVRILFVLFVFVYACVCTHVGCTVCASSR
jgi:Rieske Fe-S protein